MPKKEKWDLEMIGQLYLEGRARGARVELDEAFKDAAMEAIRASVQQETKEKETKH